MHRRARSFSAPLLLAVLAGAMAVAPAAPAGAMPGAGPTVAINEIHYDNAGADSGEFVEIAASQGSDLGDYDVVLYNGNGGVVYDTDAVPATPSSTAGGFDYYVVEYPSNGIQNGSPDGVALQDAEGALVEFLSYEGTITAVGGPADGQTSTDIGVAEAGDEPAGQSLQRAAPTSQTWFGPDTATPGAANTPSEDPPIAQCDAAEGDIRLISEVQGAGEASPLATGTPRFTAGTTVTIEGAVTVADADLNGFFVQEEPGDEDANPLTSEGVFVSDAGEFGDLLTPGQIVQVTGAVTESFDRTQIGGGGFPVTDVAVCDVDDVAIEPVPLPLPSDDAQRESYEGMVIAADDQVVSGSFDAYSFGELVTGYRGLLETSTNEAPPGPLSDAVLVANDTRELRIDDRSSSRRDSRLDYATDDLRLGARVSVVGALDYSFSNWKVQYTEDPQIDDIPLDAVPTFEGGNDIVGFNVLNYFNTFGDSAALRGARNAEQFEIQSAKVVAAISQMDAAVVGLVEIENDYEEEYDGDAGTVPSAQTLVDELNEATAPGTYDWIRVPESLLTGEGLAGGGLGTDAIAVGLIYQPDRATPIGEAATFDIDRDLNSDNNRWPIAQTFEVDGQRLTAVVNHFKSKGSSCEDVSSTGDPSFAAGEDVDDESTTASCDLTRRYAANELLDWLDTDPTGAADDDYLLLGDYNSYAEEEPIQIIRRAGYTDLVRALDGDAFTYKFSGRVGRLDYAFSSSTLTPEVTGTAVWQINSRAQYADQYFIDPIDVTGPEGSSDHDPVVLALQPGAVDPGDPGDPDDDDDDGDDDDGSNDDDGSDDDGDDDGSDDDGDDADVDVDADDGDDDDDSDDGGDDSDDDGPDDSNAPSLPPAGQDVDRVVERLAGVERVETAARISASSFAPGVDVAYVATAGGFADALTGSAAAGATRGPVLLVTDEVPGPTAAELERLQPGRIVVLGGTDAIDQEVVEALEPYTVGDVVRLAGPDRFATAAAISAATFEPGVDVAYVATGATFPDSLAGAAAAGRDRGPVLLAGSSLAEGVLAELRRLDPGRIVVLGGEDAVGADIATTLASIAPVERLGGPDRFATGAAIADTFPAPTGVVYVATGADFPDALTVAPAAALTGSPVLLVTLDDVPSATAASLERLDPNRVVVAGGEAVVRDAVLQSLDD